MTLRASRELLFARVQEWCRSRCEILAHGPVDLLGAAAADAGRPYEGNENGERDVSRRRRCLAGVPSHTA